MSELFRVLESRTAKQREQMQSAARPARVRYYILTKGVGEHRSENPLDFAAYFLEEPSFTYGAVAVNELPKGAVPLCGAVVLSWEVNEQGLYTGANMAYIVDGTRRNEEMRFSLVFEGVALRTASPMNDEAQ